MAKLPTPEARSGRTKRSPVNGRNILSVQNKEPGYVYRFVNDTGDRVETFKEAGWELEESEDIRIGDKRVNASSGLGSKAQVSVGKDGTKAFLMKIKEEWYNEDQKAKADFIKEQEQSMKQSALSSSDYGKIEISR